MLTLVDRVSPQVLRLGALVVVILCVLAFFGTQIENYYEPRLFTRISTSVSIMALIAVGQALVILTRNIDLSVGSVVGFAAYVTGNLVIASPDLNPALVILAAILVGAAFGAINGVLVAYAKIPSIIVTLGTLALFRTLLVDYSGAKSITTGNLPAWIVELPRLNLFSVGGFDLRVTFAVAVLVVVVTHLALTRLRAGRTFYAVGSNPDAAIVAGIDSARTIFIAFVLSGALAGLAGFMFLSRFGNITVVAGLGFELKSVAAAVVGGVNIFGGSGTVIGTLLGAILVDLLETSLVRWQLVSEFWREAVLGFLILLSVAADTILMRRLLAFRQKRARAEAQKGMDSAAKRYPLEATL
jgi:rhamnose transport system permease protein